MSSNNSNYVVTQAPDLSSLGRVKDHLYYTESEVQLNEIETSSTIGRYIKSFNSKTMNSVGECLLPNLDGVEQTYVHLRLPPLSPNTILAAGWGYHAVQAVNLQLGSSNISLQEKRGYTNYQELWWSCETKEKRDLAINLGGVAKLAGADTEPHDAVIILNLPFSTLKNIANKRSFDASLLSSPILIQIQWAPVTNYMSTSTGETVNISNYPNSFEIANLIVRQDVLTDKSQSLRQTIMSSDVFAVYPYSHVLSGSSSTQTLAVVNKKCEMNVDLSGFLNSDLIAISFSVNKYSHLNSTIVDDATANKNTVCNPGSTYRCKNIRLYYNGSTLFELSHYLTDLHQLSVCHGDPHGENHRISNDGSLTADAGNAFQYYLSFTADMRNQFMERLANVPRYSQQPMELRFEIEVPLPADIDANNNFQSSFRSSYYYNAVNLMSKGNSNVFFT